MIIPLEHSWDTFTIHPRVLPERIRARAIAFGHLFRLRRPSCATCLTWVQHPAFAPTRPGTRTIRLLHLTFRRVPSGHCGAASSCTFFSVLSILSAIETISARGCFLSVLLICLPPPLFFLVQYERIFQSALRFLRCASRASECVLDRTRLEFVHHRAYTGPSEEQNSGKHFEYHFCGNGGSLCCVRHTLRI